MGKGWGGWVRGAVLAGYHACNGTVGLLPFEQEHCATSSLLACKHLPGVTPCQAQLVSAQGYEGFGALLPGRNYNSGSYRFGFQGQEKDDEMHGATGTSYAFEYRMHDPGIGRFLSIDPLASKYPHNSPYAFSENRVIDAVELEGLEEVPYNEAARREREGLAPILKKSEWKNEDRHCACRTFAAAAEHNTSTMNWQVYEPINQVHNYYQWADNKFQAEGIDFRWFEAAEEVTAPNLGIGASQWWPASAIGGFSEETSVFLRAGNSFLMSRNMPVVKEVLAKRSFQGLTGKEAGLRDGRV